MPDNRVYISSVEYKRKEFDRKTKIKSKYQRYIEVKRQYHNKEINWNTYCKLSKKYYQDNLTLQLGGINN